VLYTILMWIVFGWSGRSHEFGIGRNLTSGLSQGQSEQEKNEITGVKCNISAPNLQWRLKDTTATVSLEVEFHGKVDVVVMPSVQLTALPKRANELEQDQYWAPFDLASGASTNHWKRLTNGDETQRHTLQLVPSKLSWARTKSSVWPSRTFAGAIPPGQYSLQVKLDTRDYKTILSNEVTVTIVK
jgi:hypothetical protein